MTSTPSLGYPAEFYYPEFIENRPDDPLKSPPKHLPFTPSIDNGLGSSSKSPASLEYTNETTNKRKPINKKKTAPSLALDVVTDHGLPGTDLTKLSKTDPTKNLLRNPVDKNIPKLNVDESVIKQTIRTPRIITTNLDDSLEETTKWKQINNGQKFIANGHINGDLRKKPQGQTKFIETPRKQQTVKFVGDEQPIDDYWKKEVLINDEGVVSIEPVKYDRNTYKGPFGLTRQGSFVFYIGLAVITLLAGVFLIMTGVFYGRSYPDSTSNSAKLAGIGICALVFYLGLQLILIGLWHQKYRAENPKMTMKKSNKHDDSSAHLQPSMENDDPYGYSYQQQIDYTPYGNYATPPYASNFNEQMVYQQPGVPYYDPTINEQMAYQQPGAMYYDPTVWPSNVEIEGQPDSKFLQPMEWSYGQQQPINEIPPPAPPLILTSVPNTVDNKPEKNSHRHHKKTIEANPTKPKFDNLFPNSTVTETPIPVLHKAPETTELMKSIADMEKNNQRTSTNGNLTKKNFNRVKPVDDGSDVSSVSDHHRHHRQSRRRYHRRYRRHSHSSCSTCSSYSRNDFHSDVGYNNRHHYESQYSEPTSKSNMPRVSRARTPSPPRTNRSVYRDTGRKNRTMRDSDITADLEDVPNVRDNRLEQIPVIRRTIIVEPYPAEPTSQITVKPRTNVIGKIRSGKNQQAKEDGKTIIPPSTTVSTNKKSKTNKKTTTIATNDNTITDLQLEDVTDEGHANDNPNAKSRKKKPNKISSNKPAKNAFYD